MQELQRRALALVAAVACLLALAACQTPPRGSGDTAPVAPGLTARDGVLGRSDRLLVYVPQGDDSYASIAQRFLGSAARDWEVADANPGTPQARSGQPVIVPLKPLNPMGVRSGQYQTIPILCYHRVGQGSGKMTVSASGFEQQLDWLAANNFKVIRLKDLIGFLEGRQPLPQRSVVLTFDDGYASYYRHAYPLLKKHGFPATVFLYTDFVGAGDALTWPQMQEMTASGLIDIQSHSKTHSNLIERAAGENDAAYAKRMEAEAKVPRDVIEKRLSNEVLTYAYPFGDVNEVVLEALARNRYRLAGTVTPGGNPAWAQPLMLRRTMIYGSHDLEAFKSKLQTLRSFTPSS
jgi:peptidoglycan/xylan/chitin deacetylase (PgdA/CDA1 family)